MVNLVKQLFALLVLVFSEGMVSGHAQNLSSFFKNAKSKSHLSRPGRRRHSSLRGNDGGERSEAGMLIGR
jgi:hypothetical protein